MTSPPPRFLLLGTATGLEVSMRPVSFLVLPLMVACLACSSSPGDTSGGAGPGGTSGSGASGGGGSGGSTATTTTTSSETGSCPTVGDNVYDNSAESTLPACANPVAPLPEEDGTFSVVVFGPFPQAFTLEGFTFTGWEEGNAGVTDPWTATAVVVPAGDDPLAIDPNVTAKPYPLTIIESLPDGVSSYHRYSIQLDAPLSVDACASVVVALRNTVGPPRSALAMCGLGSAHPATNQWWNLDGTLSPMASFGNNFDRDWWVSLLPAAP